MRFLEMWDKANVMKISQQQFEELQSKKIINEHNIQRYNEYVVNAKCFIANNGDIYVARDRKIMLALQD
jgi:sulfatase maturation enzyme AslB (radical SAM superfamily)